MSIKIKPITEACHH